MEKLENLRNKKYKCLEKGLDHIYASDEDDRNRELLDPNYTPEESANLSGNKFAQHEKNGQINYGGNKGDNFKKGHRTEADYLDNREFSNGGQTRAHTKKGTTCSGDNEYDNITIDADTTKECAEIHYQFENRFPSEKQYEQTPLADFSESKELIRQNTRQISSKWVIGIKIAIALLVLTLIVLAFTKYKKFLLFLQSVINWVGRQGSWSILLFILLFTFTAPLFMSVEIMCIGSGLIFSGVYGKVLGIFVAVFCVAVGYLLGMSICFFVSRYLIHDCIYKRLMTYPIYVAFNQAIDTNGLSFVLLIRFSPILPASMVSYVLGVTNLKYKHFALGSVTALPSIFLFTYIGALLQNFSNLSDMEHQWGNILVFVIGIIIGISAIVYISIVTKRRLDSMTIMHDSLASTVDAI